MWIVDTALKVREEQNQPVRVGIVGAGASWAKAWPTRSSIPYHLVHFEVPNAIARAVLFRDPVIRPLGGPVVEVCAAAKRDLTAGEVLDDYGMYMTYGEAVNVEEMCAGRYLPEGPVEGCRLRRNIPRDAVITYDDVVLPAGRLADRLRGEQCRKFRGETWPASQPIDQAAASARKRSAAPARLQRAISL